MDVMRFLLPDLMEAKQLRTAYALERYSNGAIPITTANRLVKAGYKPKRLDLETLDALVRVFNVKDMNALLKPDEARLTPPAPPSGKPAVQTGGKKKPAPRRKSRA